MIFRGVYQRSPFAGRRRPGGGLAARVLDSVTVGAFDEGVWPIEIIGNGADGETVKFVLYPDGEPDPENTDVDAGNASGGPATADGSFAWGTDEFELPTGIALGDYLMAVIVNNGALSNVVVSDPFEVDTVLPVISAEDFTGGVGGIAYAFTVSKGGPYRLSAFADAMDPEDDAAAIAAGTGAVATVTGTATAGVPVTGTLSCSAGTRYPAVYAADAFLNTATESYGAETVTAPSGIQVLAINNVYANGFTDTTGATGSSIAIQSGSNRLIVAMLSYVQIGSAPSAVGVTIGGVAMTLVDALGSGTAGIPKVQFFILKEASLPSGTQAVAFTADVGLYMVDLTILQLAGVSQGTSMVSPDAGATLSDETSMDVISLTTAAAGSLVITGVSILSTDAQTFGMTTNTGSITRITAHEQAGGLAQATGGYQIVAGSGVTVTHDATWTSAVRWGRRIAEVRAA